MTIHEMKPQRLKESLDLVWRVFLEFEAPEYSEQGVATFYEFIEHDAMAKRMQDGEISLWYALEDDKVVGVVAVRPQAGQAESQANGHISLLFVEKLHHKKGIARRMVETATSGHTTVTVNSSPYAVEVYKRLGFVPTDCEQLQNGIRYTPMKRGENG